MSKNKIADIAGTYGKRDKSRCGKMTLKISWVIIHILTAAMILFLTACTGKEPVKHFELESESLSEGSIDTSDRTDIYDIDSAETEVLSQPELEYPADSNITNGFLVVIDAGHQAKGNSEKEPIGPGAAEMKAKVAGGTSGRTTDVPEYELTLQLALKLQEELELRGYEVLMVRTTNDVNISNAERAAIANDAGADVFIRIHANGSENTSVSGAMTICQTPNNPYNGTLYAESKALSTYVLDELVAAAGCKKEYVWETDSMSGINWCQVPVTIVEVGYMTNPEEEALLVTDAYQDKLVQGVANGIDKYRME